MAHLFLSHPSSRRCPLSRRMAKSNSDGSIFRLSRDIYFRLATIEKMRSSLELAVCGTPRTESMLSICNAFGKYKEAIEANKVAQKTAKTSRDELLKANKQADDVLTEGAKAKVAIADTVASAAKTDKENKENKWNNTRDKSESSYIRIFRVSLIECSSLGRLFDLWYMSSNTHTGCSTPNEQSSPLEMLHAHHLHITVDDPEIL